MGGVPVHTWRVGVSPALKAVLPALSHTERSLPASGPRAASGVGGGLCSGDALPATWPCPPRLEKTCTDLLQTTLCSPKCPEQLQLLCAAILRERSPSDGLSLSCDHVQSSQQLSLVASVLLVQVTCPPCPCWLWAVRSTPCPRCLGKDQPPAPSCCLPPCPRGSGRAAGGRVLGTVEAALWKQRCS